eukprot:EG_transcript_8414
MGHKYTKIVGTEPPHDPCLYLGSIDWVIEDEVLDEFSIRAVLSVLPRQPQYSEEVLRNHHIPETDYMVYPLEDSNDEYISIFEAPGILAACDFVHRKRLEGKTVLVHCDAGITRSPAVVVSYLMKYGPDLHHPSHMKLDAAAAMVRGLRERMDICAFTEELQRLQTLLENPASLDVPTVRERSALHSPHTPANPIEWDKLKEEEDPWVELSLLRSTWVAIRSLEGGQLSFGRKVYTTLFELGGGRVEEMFLEVDMQRQSVVMTSMLRQMIWCLDSGKVDKLVKYHEHLPLQMRDFETFQKAVLIALRDKLTLDEASFGAWERFLTVAFSRWGRALLQQGQSIHSGSPVPMVDAESSGEDSDSELDPSKVYLTSQSRVAAGGAAEALGCCPFAMLMRSNGDCSLPKLSLPPKKVR